MADFRPFSDEKLDQWIASGCSPHDREAAIGEREHRQTKRALQQAAQSHQELVSEQERLRTAVDSLTLGQTAVKQSVDRLQSARLVDKAILIVTAIGSFAAVVSLVLWFLRRGQ